MDVIEVKKIGQIITFIIVSVGMLLLIANNWLKSVLVNFLVLWIVCCSVGFQLG